MGLLKAMQEKMDSDLTEMRVGQDQTRAKVKAVRRTHNEKFVILQENTWTSSAWQWLLTFLFSGLHPRWRCFTADSTQVPTFWLQTEFNCPQSRCSVMASNGGRPASGLMSLQAGEHPMPASYPHCRLSTATNCPLQLSTQDCLMLLTALCSWLTLTG
jgi:hypothetical protein